MPTHCMQTVHSFHELFGAITVLLLNSDIKVASVGYLHVTARLRLLTVKFTCKKGGHKSDCVACKIS